MKTPTDDTPKFTLAVSNVAPKPWQAAEVPPGWRLDKNGVWFLKRDKDGSEEPVQVSGPVWVIALARDGRKRDWGTVVQWLEMDGGLHQWAMPRQRLHEQGPGLAQELAAEGLFIIPGQERRLNAYLGHFQPKVRFQSVPVLGWAEDASGRLVYVLPASILAPGESIERVVFQPERYSPTQHTMHPSGLLQQWIDQVATPCRGNPLLIFGLCVAFTGPLLKHTHLSDGGFHVYGLSSRGKTTLAQVAASVWGCGADPSEAPSLAYVQRWNATANALEGLAAAHNDGILILDELGTCSAADFGQVVYNLAGGQGKSAFDSNRNLKSRRQWRIMILSTGEASTRAKIEERGKTSRGGHLVRLLDIRVSDEVISDPHGEAPAQFVRSLKRTCATVYGTAGPAFVVALLERFSDVHALRVFLKERMDQIAEGFIPTEASQEQARAMQKLVQTQLAGRLAAELGILPFEPEEIDDALHLVRDLWMEEGASLPDAERGIEAVKDFMLKHETRFREMTSPDPVRDAAGFIDRGRRLYLFTRQGFKEACNGQDHREVARALADRSMLFRDDLDRYVSKHCAPGHGKDRLSLYAVKIDLLSR